MINHQKNGFMVKIDNIDKMCEYLKIVLLNEEYQERIKENAFEIALKYSFWGVKRELKNVYDFEK